ncbi:MAG: hypothetical protein KKA07_10255 [Bacteroidetes bacterium]|nr:hypothetical protein [Bacteroidota bacterium]MBU1719443.1 hypothetical protein [Bacteroidota bacterium]
MIKKLIFTIAAISGFALLAEAQCYKKALCATTADGYDYTGQSTFTKLMSGDTAQFDLIFYSSKDYKIIVCGEDFLGDVQFSIFYKTKEATKEIKEIMKRKETVFKVDEYGQKMYDGNYNPIVEGEKWVVDTVWITRVTTGNIIFDSKDEGKSFWEIQKVDRTKRVVVQVVVPKIEQDKFDKGCISVLIGYKNSR